jgi:hypothetical protein
MDCVGVRLLHGRSKFILSGSTARNTADVDSQTTFWFLTPFW